MYGEHLDEMIRQQDNMMDSEAVQSVMEYFKPGAEPWPFPSIEETGGILTTGSTEPERVTLAAIRGEERGGAWLKEKAAERTEETAFEEVPLPPTTMDFGVSLLWTLDRSYRVRGQL